MPAAQELMRMPATILPSAFVWSKMGAESGEALAAIIRRKELEREAGGGVFVWGIGQSLGDGLSLLRAVESAPRVLFSPMPSKAKFGDASPSSLLVWTAYRRNGGTTEPLPPHVLVTSRGNIGPATKTHHYALLCRSAVPLTSGPVGAVSPARMRNLASGHPLGASQVTALVSHDDAQQGGREYPISFAADLLEFIRLDAPLQVPLALARDLDQVASSATVEDWLSFVGKVLRQEEAL